MSDNTPRLQNVKTQRFGKLRSTNARAVYKTTTTTPGKLFLVSPTVVDSCLTPEADLNWWLTHSCLTAEYENLDLPEDITELSTYSGTDGQPALKAATTKLKNLDAVSFQFLIEYGLRSAIRLKAPGTAVLVMTNGVTYLTPDPLSSNVGNVTLITVEGTAVSLTDGLTLITTDAIDIITRNITLATSFGATHLVSNISMLTPFSRTTATANNSQLAPFSRSTSIENLTLIAP